MSFEINKELSPKTLQTLQTQIKDNEIIIIKFTADWCGPCQGIKHTCQEYTNRFNSKVHYYEIDIDDSLELYIKLKSLKMVNGIPAILCYHAKERDFWYCPDDSCIGGDKTKVIEFYERCLNIIK